MHETVHKAIADIEAGRQVVCTMEEYYATVRLALQRYAMAQAAGRWPGAYRSRWERLLVWVGRRYATRFLGRRYYRRAHGVSSPADRA